MKKRLVFGLGALLAGLAGAIGVKKLMDRDYHTVSRTEDGEDRGVGPIEGKKKDEVQNVKPDAINDGYKPVKY